MLTNQIPQNQPIDVAFDGAGAVRQRQAIADCVKIASEIAGEGRDRSQCVLFDAGDPVLEAVSLERGHHRGERCDVLGEPVQFGDAPAQGFQLVGVLLRESVGVGRDPGGDLADRGRFGRWEGSVSASGPVTPQVALDRQFASCVAELLDLAVELGGVAGALVPAAVQMFDVRVDEVCALQALGHDLVGGGGVDQFADGCLVQAELAADRRFGHALSPQLVDSGVVLAKPRHDLQHHRGHGRRASRRHAARHRRSLPDLLTA